jgi:hypothetical protein
MSLQKRLLQLLGAMLRLTKWLIWLLSGEWMLHGQANGGHIVLVRSLWTALVIFFAAIAIEQRLDEGATWRFDARALRTALDRNIEWLGAILAVTYVGYYSRFAAQWSYLAGVYNQIMACQVQTPPGSDTASDRIYSVWWAAFIEDAEDVHLALKHSFAATIAHCLGDASIRKLYEQGTVQGQQRLAALEVQLSECLGAASFEEMKRRGRNAGGSTVRPPAGLIARSPRRKTFCRR